MLKYKSLIRKMQTMFKTEKKNAKMTKSQCYTLHIEVFYEQNYGNWFRIILFTTFRTDFMGFEVWTFQPCAKLNNYEFIS